MSTTPLQDPAAAPPESVTGPALRRTLTLRHIVFIGLAYMAPLAVFDTFGIVADITNGHVPLAYLLILLAVGITALSYARMVRFYPRAGSAYTYAREAINPHLGFLVGWAATLDYLLLPMINALLASIYMSAAFPEVPAWVWIFSTIIITTALNVIGVQITARINVALVVVQLVVAVAFVALTIKNIIAGANGAEFSALPFFAPDVDFSAIAAGAAVLALSFLGFDAVSTLAEEAQHPRRDIPRAIFIIVAIAGVFFVAVTYFMQVLFPDVAAVGDIVGASPAIAKYIGGAAFQAMFIGGYMMAVLGCGITQQLSAARLVYAMGRDRVLPERPFAKLNRAGVPAINVLIIALIACSAAFLDLYQASSLINFGAFVAFFFVNASVIFTWVRFIRPTQPRLGLRGALGYLVLPLIGSAVSLMLWLSLEPSAMLLGAVWVALGFMYLLARTRGFRAAPPALQGPQLD